MAGDCVWSMNFHGQPKWVEAVIEKPTGSGDLRIASARQQSVETSPGSFARAKTDRVD